MCYTDVEIKGGNVTMLIRYGYDIIHIKKTFNLCDTLASNNLNCPLKPNMVALGIQASIPFKIPTVSSSYSSYNNYNYQQPSLPYRAHTEAKYQ